MISPVLLAVLAVTLLLALVLWARLHAFVTLFDLLPGLERTSFGFYNMEEIAGPGDAPHIVHCLGYLPGRPLEEAPLSEPLIGDIGGTIARLDRALRGFHHPAAGQALLWHIHLLPQLRDQGVHIQDAELRGQVARVINDFAGSILPALMRLRAQVIHHDANGSNLIVEADNPDRIAGVIDFGDMTHGALACEPAVTAADLFRAPDLLDRLCPLLAAYDAVLPLEDDEIDLIYDLLLARLAITIIIQ